MASAIRDIFLLPRKQFPPLISELAIAGPYEKMFLVFYLFHRIYPFLFSSWKGGFLTYLFMQLLWYLMFFAHTSPLSFRNMNLIWI